MKSIYIFVFAGMFSFTARSQSQFETAGNFLKSVSAQYQQEAVYSVKLAYNLYESHTASVPKEQDKGELKVSGNRYYHSISNATTVSDGEYCLLIAKEVHEIILKKEGAQEFSIPKIWMDSLHRVFSSVEIIPVKSGVKLSYSAPNADIYQYKSIDVILDTIQQTVTGIVFFYRNPVSDYDAFKKAAPPRLEVLYQHYNFSPSFRENEFSIDPYVQYTAGEFRPVGVYKDFKIRVLTSIP